MYKLTKHASKDRIDRLIFIVENIGIGEIVCSAKQEKGNATVAITDTGVLLVLAQDGNTIITAWIASIADATHIWRKANGECNMPQWLYEKIVRHKGLYTKCKKQDSEKGYGKKNRKFY